jgi:RNA polymerase sigma-70 factor (ECF subfamily)
MSIPFLAVAPSSAQAEPDSSDGSLLRHARAGSQQAATQLYLRYADRLERLVQAQRSPDLACRFDPEDVVQSVFSSFFRAVNQGLYDVPDGQELWNLLLVIALNKVRAKGNYHRAACRDVRLTQNEGTSLRQAAPRHYEDASAEVVLKLVVEDLLERLPESQRQIVSDRIAGHEVVEIAERSGWSRRTVERVLQEFRHLLDGVLQAES